MKGLLLAGTLSLGLHALFFCIETQWVGKNTTNRFHSGPVALVLNYREPQKLITVPEKSPEKVRKTAVNRHKTEKKKQPEPEIPKRIRPPIQIQKPKPIIKVKPIPLVARPVFSEKEKTGRSKITHDTLIPPVNEALPDSDIPETVKEGHGFPPVAVQESYQERTLPSEPARILTPAAQIVRKAALLYLENPPPKYPRIARRKGHQGTVILEVHVNREGRVEKMRVFQSSGYHSLDKAAMKSVKNWVFKPGKRGDKKIEMWVKVPVKFQFK